MPTRRVTFIDVVSQWLIVGFASAFVWLFVFELLPKVDNARQSAVEAKTAAEAAKELIKQHLKEHDSWEKATD